MLNIPIIYRALGTLLYIEGILLALCLGLGCWFSETNHLAFGVPTAVALSLIHI